MISPFSIGTARSWHLQKWLALEARLVGNGYQTITLDHREGRIGSFSGGKLIAAPPRTVVGLMRSAACVIGNDSGMAHLAGTLDVPAVALCGCTPGAKIFDLYPSVDVVQSSTCAGCYRDCGGVDGITVDTAYRAIMRAAPLLGITGGRALPNVEKLAVIRDAILSTNDLEGDVAEIGVYRGGTAKLMQHYGRPGTVVRLYDTFRGMPSDDSDPGGAHRSGDFADTSADEVRRFLDSPLAVLHVGTFPSTAPPDARYRCVHVDADIYQSTKAAIEYFVPRMTPGGKMVFDDLDLEGTPGVRRAIDEAGLSVSTTTEHQGIITLGR